jgi:hypothetical protein
MFTTASHWSLSRARWIQSTSLNSVFLRFIFSNFNYNEKENEAYVVTFLSLCVPTCVCVSPLNFWRFLRPRDHLFVCVSPLIFKDFDPYTPKAYDITLISVSPPYFFFSLGGLIGSSSCLCVSVCLPNILIFYAVHVVSKESRRLDFPPPQNFLQYYCQIYSYVFPLHSFLS